jgi:hypothetical protein
MGPNHWGVLKHQIETETEGHFTATKRNGASVLFIMFISITKHGDENWATIIYSKSSAHPGALPLAEVVGEWAA